MIGCKAHKKKNKSIKAVVTSLKLNTNKVLKEIRFCLKFFRFHLVEAFVVVVLGLFFFFQNWPFILFEKKILCAFKVMVKKLLIPV